MNEYEQCMSAIEDSAIWTKSLPSMLTWARFYASSFGWSVFPLIPRSKKPLTEHGFHDASRDLDQIHAWWTRWPAANIAVDCERSSLVVIDVDCKTSDGYKTFGALCAAEPEIGVATWISTTGSGGQHRFFAAPQIRIASNTGRLGMGIDVRAAGGYAVLPPSLYPNGNRYRWSTSLAETPIAPLPQDVIGRLTARSYRKKVMTPPEMSYPITGQSRFDARAVIKREIEQLRHAVEGMRNDTLNKCAFVLNEIDQVLHF